jgi:hypothetical protein
MITHMPTDDLLGIQEIADLAGVSGSAVSNWRIRAADFPTPVAVLSSGPVFNGAQIRAWLAKRPGTEDAVARKPTCLVICPIGNELAPVGHPDRERWERSIETWEKLIEPACVANGLEPIRADQIAKAGEITDQVFKLIQGADFVIADVSGGNPNVMYELGLRHTMSKCTIQIGEFGQLPFDIAAIRTLQFSRTPAGLVDGRKKLEAAVAAGLNEEFDPVTATRIWASPALGEILSPAVDQPPLEIESEEPGVFELLATMEGAFPELLALTQGSVSAMGTMTALTQAATEEIHKSDAAKQGFAGRLRVANKLATALSPVADDLENLAQAYEDRLASIHAGMNCLLTLVEENPSQLATMEEFPKSLQTFVASVRQANKMQTDFASKVIGSGKFSKPLRVSTRRIADATRRVAKALALAEVWNSRMQQIIDRAASADSSQPA